MYEYDEYNPKKKDEYEETEQESIDYSADGMEDEPHVDGESIEMDSPCRRRIHRDGGRGDFRRGIYRGNFR